MSVTLYRVGGCVRDKIMNIKPKDIDFCCECSSFNEMKNYILSRGGTIFLEKPEYLTIRAKLNGEAADFVVCRSDGSYSDGRRPDSTSVGDIFSDLSRRDFTMNAIAQNVETGEYVDPFDGKGDIALKLIRCVGNTCDRFTEDSLRILRAIRFSITKGFTLDFEIVKVLNDRKFVKLLDNVSIERIREELTRCFAFNTFKTIEALNNFPELRDHIFVKGNLVLIPTIRN